MALEPRAVRLAALVTDYRPGTHADVLLSKFLHGFPCDEPEVHPPRSVIASLYIDQFPPGEIGRAVAKAHGIPLYNSIQAALTLGDGTYYEDHSAGGYGTGSAEGAAFAFKEPSGGPPARGALHLAPQLAVDGVLIIAEHGDWPWNEEEARIHPRKAWLEQVCAVFAQSGGRVCPVFNGADTNARATPHNKRPHDTNFCSTCCRRQTPCAVLVRLPLDG
jgi:hypothetical protein